MDDLIQVLCVRCGDRVFDMKLGRHSNGTPMPKDLTPAVACYRCARAVASPAVLDLPVVQGESFQEHLARLAAAKEALRARLPATFGRHE